jgi:aconitase A
LINIWPSRALIQAVEKQSVIPAMFQYVYARIENGSNAWQCLQAPDGQIYPWDVSIYLHKKPYVFQWHDKGINHNIINSMNSSHSFNTNIYCLDITWYSISERGPCIIVSW